MQEWIQTRFISGYGILDLYGGSANLSRGLSAQASEIHCVDLLTSESDDCGENVHYHQSAVLPWLKHRIATQPAQTRDTHPKPYLAIIDPPRKGLGEDGFTIITYLEQLGVDRAILIGCKTDPWSRDLGRFIQQTWTLEDIAVFDFFPQTYHVETAALLSKKSSKSNCR